MTLQLRSIISNADGRRAEYMEDGKFKSKQYPVGASDKDILADFAIGRSPRGRDGRAPANGGSSGPPETGAMPKPPDDSKTPAKGKDGKAPETF